MYDRILVPTDGSASSRAAMGTAIELADAHEAAIHVLHVIDTRVYDTSIESAVQPLERTGERYLDDLVALAEGHDLTVTTAIERGRPARAILEIAEDEAVDLIVMGTTGRGALERRLLGSVTEYVVTHANVPVHVVPASDDGDT